MAEHDYKKLGFKCGLEIHQQLDTNKLFCNCPSIVHDKNPDIVFERKLRAIAGETGQIDKAASYEQSKEKFYKYQGCSTSCCLVEMDEEPPQPANSDAVKIVLQVAKAMNAKIVDEIHFMRKTVIDGSNVSGFQRTALVGINGVIETSLGDVVVENICLEEEAARKVETTDDYVKYRLDRLGVPLIEIATDASIQSPEHAKEVAQKLGMILRSTGKVKRGIGSIRQDVNVSIAKGVRVEVKGFQDLKSIPRVIENEVNRQLKLDKKGEKEKPHVRKAESDFSTKYLRPMPGAARMYPETDILPIEVTEELISGLGDIEMIEDKIESMVKDYKISKNDAAEMIKRNIPFDSYVKKFSNVSSKFIASTILEITKDIKSRDKLDVDKLTTVDYEEVFSKINSKDINENKDTVREILVMKLKNGKVDYSKFKPMDLGDVETEIKAIVEKNKGAPFGAIMGQVMGKFRGKVDGKVISDLIKKFL